MKSVSQSSLQLNLSYHELVAYIAGLIDGEGYIGIVNNGKSNYGSLSYLLKIRVVMVDQAPIDLLYTIFGGSRKNYSRTGNRQDVWQWEVTTKDDVSKVLATINPYVLVKRLHVQYGLLYLTELSMNEKNPELREKFYLKFKELNIRGRMAQDIKDSEDA